MLNASRGRAKIGVFVPFTNTNLEADMSLLKPSGVSVHFARLGGYDIDEIPDETQMSNLGSSDIEEPLRLLAGVRPDVVMYGCTSATLTHGPKFDRGLAESIHKSTGAKSITAAGSIIFALQKLDAKKISFASPYVETINQQAIDFIQSFGFDVVSTGEVDDQLDNYGQGALSPDKVYELGLGAMSPDSDVLVLSCTDMRSVEAIDKLEKSIGKPVVTSNQAMMFEAMSIMGMNDIMPELGSLFERL